MCLAIKPGTKFKQTKRDIVVYKVVIVDFFMKNERSLYTSYKHSYIGEINDLPIHLKLDVNTVINVNRTFDSIEIGFHSFIRKRDSFIFARIYKEKLFKCIIPKGAFYIRGTFNLSLTPSIVSTEIIYQEILN